MKSLDKQDLIDALIALETHGTKTKAANALSLPVSTFKSRIKKALLEGVSLPKDYESKQNITVMEKTEDVKLIQAVGTEIKTVEQLVEKAGIDLSKFEVTKPIVRTWTVTMKLKQHNEGSSYEIPYQAANYYVSAEFRRKAPKFIQDGIEELCKNLPKHRKPASKNKASSSGKMLELVLFDAHFGKLSRRAITGQEYSLQSAEEIYTKAVDDLLQKAKVPSLDKIVLPIGNDFFHSNNWKSQTEKGTQIESVSDHMAHVFAAGQRAIAKCVDKCSQICPVELFWVPGNHDPETSWYLLKVLEAQFQSVPHVSVDISLGKHKYLSYGEVLVLFTHGDSIKRKKNLPLFMATHCPRGLWDKARHREIHTGHLHTLKETCWETMEELHGVVWRSLPSLSATDKWHDDNLYTGNQRSGQALIWDEKQGLDSFHFSYVEDNA